MGAAPLLSQKWGTGARACRAAPQPSALSGGPGPRARDLPMSQEGLQAVQGPPRAAPSRLPHCFIHPCGLPFSCPQLGLSRGGCA